MIVSPPNGCGLENYMLLSVILWLITVVGVNRLSVSWHQPDCQPGQRAPAAEVVYQERQVGAS